MFFSGYQSRVNLTNIMAILSTKDKTYGAETSSILISIATYDLVRITALSGVCKYLLCSFI